MVTLAVVMATAEESDEGTAFSDSESIAPIEVPPDYFHEIERSDVVARLGATAPSQ